jgi:hypothetical protein
MGGKIYFIYLYFIIIIDILKLFLKMLDYMGGLVAKWHERSEYAIPLRRG